MAKTVHDDVLDQAFNYIKDNSAWLCVCSTEPTTYTEAVTTYKLARVAIDSTDFTGPAAGDTNGRKLTSNEQGGMTVDVSATAAHIALCDSVNSKLLYVTTCTPALLQLGNTVTVPAWDIEIADPS